MLVRTKHGDASSRRLEEFGVIYLHERAYQPPQRHGSIPVEKHPPPGYDIYGDNGQPPEVREANWQGLH